jgi:hypothetical protein
MQGRSHRVVEPLAFGPMHWLARLYDRRIINVNVNIVVAGIIAMAITVGVMHLANRFGFIEDLQGVAPNFRAHLFGRKFEIIGQKLVISGLTFIVDLVADVAVYYGLHWLANHMPRKKPRPRSAYTDLTFMRDATLVQFERAIISPILYAFALGLQNALLHQGVGVEKATALGFCAGIAASRTLHTLWMLRQERRAGRMSAADIVGPDTAAK